MVKKKIAKKFNSTGYVLAIIKDNNKLMFWNLNLPNSESIPESETTFHLEALNMRITYEKNENEINSHLVLHQQEYGEEEIYKRLEPSILTRKELEELVEESKLLKKKYSKNRTDRKFQELVKKAEFNPRYYEEREQYLRHKDYTKKPFKEFP